MEKWQKKEKDDAKSFGGKRTPKSGGYWSFPGDVTTKHFLIDSKTTEKKGFRVTESMWKKIYYEALKARKLPVLSISLINEDIELVVLDKNDFISFLKDDRMK